MASVMPQRVVENYLHAATAVLKENDKAHLSRINTTFVGANISRLRANFRTDFSVLLASPISVLRQLPRLGFSVVC